MTNAPSTFVPVVPAGGSGTRLWPLSRAAHPKFLLDLTGTGRSLVEATIDRLAPLATGPVIVVTGAAHEEAVRAQVGQDARVLVEPSARNSMPAIAWAAAYAAAEDPEAIIGSFAADHLISDTESFADVVRRAREAAELGYLVTIGIEPTHPATGFGYIEIAEETDAALGEIGAHRVSRFVEKPARERAEQFLATGRFVWNAGMFVVKARVLLEALDRLQPAVSAGARALVDAARADAAHTDDPESRGALAADPEVWETMTAMAIDHALAEPLAAQGQVACVRATFDWDDVGDFRALGQQLRESGEGSAGLRHLGAPHADEASDVTVLGDAPVHAHGASGTVYASGERLVVLVGVEGLSVVDTDDALLVLGDEHAQDMSAVVSALRASGQGERA